MQKTANPIRVLGAGALFLAILATSGFFVARINQPTEKAETITSPPVKTIFYYSSIGNAPKGLQGQKQPHGKFAGKQFTLEILTVAKQPAAESKLMELRKQGVLAFYTPIFIGNEVEYRVRNGVFSSKEAAIRAKKKLRKAHKISAAVVRL